MSALLAADYFGQGVVQNLGYFWAGLAVTLEVSLLSAALSLAIGLVVAVLRVTPSGGLKVLSIAYTEFFRNTPLLVQALAFFFGLPRLGIQMEVHLGPLNLNQSFTAGVLALSLYTGAYVAETIRAGLLSVARGQTEAARSLGLSLGQTLRHVVLPQAVRLVIPPLGNLYNAMVKNSAVLSAIGLSDLMFQGDLVNNRTFRTFEVLTAVIVFYLLLTLPLAWGVNWLEQKLNPLRAQRLRLKGARQ